MSQSAPYSAAYLPTWLLKLSALGLVPGCFVRLQQRFPAYVVRVGETLLSLDDAVAATIMVSREVEPGD